MATTAAILDVLVRANTASASASLARLDGQLKGTAATANRTAAATSAAGRRIATGLKYAAAGAVAVGAASTKMAYDFETSMEHVRTLVGASQKQVDEWSQDLLDLAPKVGKSPKELADALYFVSSSGIKTSKVLNTVKVAAEASALGLGESERVADALTSAMNAYATSGLSARDATNVLIKTVKFGKLEADDLAGSIGRVIPVSSQLGVSFDDVGAALASMSLQGLDAAEATTALRAIFTSVIKPTDASEKALASVGLSAAGLRDELDKKGTLATLNTLSQAFDGNVESIGKVFPNVRALVGAFNLTGENAEQNAKIFKALGENTDDLGKSWGEFSQTPAQKMRAAMAGIQAAMTRVGMEVLPVVADEFKKFSDIISDKKLTSEEKISKLGQQLTKAVEEWGPQLAKAGGALGVSLLKGIAGAFWHSDILGKLFIAGTFIRLLGGPGVFGKIGALMGTKLLGGMSTTIAEGQGLKGISTRLGSAMGGWAGPLVAAGIVSALAGIEVGKSGIVQDATTQMKKYADFLAGKFDLTQHRAKRVVEYMKKHPGLGAEESLEAMNYNKAFGPLFSGFDKLGKKSRQSRDGVVEDLQTLDRNLDRSGDSTRDFAKTSSGNFLALSDTAGGAFLTIIQNLNNSLGKLGAGADKVDFSVKKAREGKMATGNPHGLQRGGHISEGAPSGDSVPALLEKDEYVLNRNAVAKVGKANLDRVNFGLAPRFQKGGAVGSPDFGGHPSNVNANLAKLIATMQSHFPGLAVTATRDGSHVRGSDHYSGDAVDLASGDYGYMDKAAGWVMSSGIYRSLKQGIHNPNLHVNAGQVVDPSFFASVWAGHRNHIHLAIVGALSGAYGAAAQQVARVMLQGPDGPLKDMGQNALDKVRGAANKYLAAHQPMESESGVGYVSGGDSAVAVQIGRILTGQGFDRAAAAGIIGNAYRESLWNPASVGSGGGGLWGFTTPPISLADLQSFAHSSGKPWTDVGLQTQFMLQHGGMDLRGVLNALHSPEQTAAMFMTAWERPGVPALEERQSAARRAYNMKGWQKGGIVAKLASGGIVDIGKAIGRTFGAEDGKKVSAGDLRKRISKQLGRRIDKLSEMGIPLTGDGSDLAGRLADLRATADRYSDYASNAGTLSSDGATGLFRPGTEPDLDKLINGSEAYWTTKQLDALLKLRNALIKTEKVIDERRKKVMEMLERNRKWLRDWEQRLRKAEHKLGSKGHTPGDWKGIDPATDDVGKWNALSADKRAQLMAKFTAAGGKLPGDRKFTDSGALITAKDNPGRFPNVAGMKAVAALLKNVAIPGLKTERGQLNSARGTALSELATVQGDVPNHSILKQLPALGVLGGEIFTAQSTLAQLGAAANVTDDGVLAGLLQSQLEDARRENALLRAQMPVFQSMVPYMGEFATGGVALVGERGPELASLPSGTRVTSAAETRSMMEPEVSLILNDCTIDTHGQTLEEAVKVVVNDELREVGRISQRRTPTPV